MLPPSSPALLRSCLLALLLVVSAAVAARADEKPLNFTTDVLPLLSKHACNSGGCHGKAIGQNGFKLSLYGFDPEADYAALVHDGRGRRVSPAAPGDSLFLLKATGGVAHGGGVRFATDSDAYRLMVKWIEQGLPWGNESDPVETKIEVTPQQVVVSGKSQQPLKVVAHYSDGSTRDITTTARYDSQQPEVLSVDEAGVVTTTGTPGEGDVMIRYGNFVATARVTLPLGPALSDDAYAPFQPVNFIDELALAKWRMLHIAPSPAASDAEFQRRLFLDVLGTLPTPDEVRAFLADTSADKRDKLIDQVLERPEYADWWAHRWGEVLRNRIGDSSFKDHSQAFHKWIRQSLADNKPYDQFVREIVTVTGKRSDHPQMDWWRTAIKHEVRVEDMSQAFLGLRVSCANCHNHPFENISQDDYWQFAAFFAKLDSPGYGAVDELKLKDDGVVKHPRTDKPVTPRAFHGPAVEYVKGEDPRLKLADWMTSPENPYFARSLVNRLWGHYLGLGLVDPVDDMRGTNPPSNPELLDALARDFADHKFDMKHLTRTILRSRVYQLSSLPTEQNQADKRNFARHYPRRLSPHVLMDALASATGTQVKFDDYPEIKRAIHLPSEKGRSEFLDMFGRSQRDTPCECETSLAPNIGQVMYLLHSDDLQRKLADKNGRCAALAAAGKPAAEIVEELFLVTFSRLPTEMERQAAVSALESAEEKQRQAAIEDLLWVLCNSQEFLFNH